MKRTISQIFFNHLPGQMQRDTGTKLITQVVGAQPVPVQTAFKEKIMEKAEALLAARGIVNPSSPFKAEDYVLVRAEKSTQELFPTILQCQRCGHIRYTRVEDFRNKENMVSLLAWCNTCKGEANLQQLDLVVFHECGLLDQPRVEKCTEKDHGYKFISLDRGLTQNPMAYQWRCTACNRPTGPFFDGSQHRGCPFDYAERDGAKVPQKATVKSYRDSGVFRRQGFELVNHSLDQIRRARSNPELSSHLAKMHLGLIPIGDVVESLRSAEDSEATKSAVTAVEAILKFLGKSLKDLPELKARNDPDYRKVKEFCQQSGINLERILNPPSKAELASLGLDPAKLDEKPLVDELLDFYQLRHADYGMVSWGDWTERAMEIPTFDTAALEVTRSTLSAFDFLDAFYVKRLPVAHVAVGFERGRLRSSKRALRFFPQVGEDESRLKRPFYVHDLKTEAIVFQLRAAAVTDWLSKQKIPGEAVPMGLTESAARVVLLNRINTKLLDEKKYDEMDDPFTDHVYTLIHTMSHALIKTINPFSGDDSSNMGELMFPHIPAFAIFLRKFTEFTMGSVEYLYQRNLSRWLLAARELVATCINDPSCRYVNPTSSCFGCLQGSEISCARFNRSLNRDLVFDFPTQKRRTGFWVPDA